MEKPIHLAPATWRALSQIAVSENCSIQDVVRGAVDRDLYRRTRAKKAVRPDERLVAPLRALLADDFAHSETWSDLHRRLAAKGYRLIEAGAGLALCEINTNKKLCKASDLGNSYGRLMRRFGCAMPGHSHAYLEANIRAN